MTIGINKIPPRVSNDSSLGRPRENSIYVGIVKKNDDPQRMGRLWVYIPELGGDPTDPDFWVICAYASPFAGATDPSGLQAGSPDAEGSQMSYGMWMVPPDLENRVLVCFAAGNTANAYWFACLFPQNMNHMVPSIAMGKTTSGDVCVAPVTEYNKASETIDPEDPNRPIFPPLTMGLLEQGLGLDDERGGTSTSARREAPSRAFGMLTPRGNSFAVDDDPENEFVRIRTRSGAQVLVHETTGYVYINSKLGNSWVEISDDGIDMYTKGSFSVRAEQNLNFRADKDIILDAGANVHVRAAGGDMTVQTTGSITEKAGGSHHIEAAGRSTLNTGGSIIRSGSNIYDNTTEPDSVNVPKPTTFTDPQPDGMTTVETITTRMPTHEPWPHHPKRQHPPKAGIEYQDASSAGAAGAPGGVDSGSFSSDPITDGEFRNKAPTVMNRLMKDLNITEEQAAGIVGNLGHESAGLQPDINEIGSGAGYGWAQWTGSRRTDFFNYASANGLDPTTDEANYRFLVHELRTSEVGSLQALRRTSTVADATRVFEQRYERAGIVNLSSRLNYANSAYSAYRGGTS